MRKCRFCKQDIQDTSRVCEHCGKSLVPGHQVKAAPLANVAPTEAPPVATTKTCPFCAEEILIAARVCKHCGRDLGAAPVAAKKYGCGTALFIVIGLVSLLAVCGRMLSTSRTSRDNPQQDAALMCHQFAKKQLRSPSTADFPTSDEATVRATADGDYEVTSYVDSQNGFGAMIRSTITCVVKPLPDGKNWRLIDLKIK